MASAFADDALPPEGVYDSREALFKAINEWAKPRGYAFTTVKSSKTPNGRVKVVYACDRNRLPPSHAVERVRRTASRKTGCKFSVLAKESLDRSTWILGHRPDKECGEHNHPPSEDPAAHPAHRRLEKRDAIRISNLATSGSAPHITQPLQILEPRRVIDAFDQRRTQPVTSTRREPSAFEEIEGRRRAPRCSRCHAIGHIMTSKACPLRFKDIPAPLAQKVKPTVEPATDQPVPARTASAEPPSSVVDLSMHLEILRGLDQSVRSPSAAHMPNSRSPSPPRMPSRSEDDMLQPAVRYDAPEAIYARYIASRQAWYDAQPAGSIKTNQQYRKAMGLPQRYDKQSYEWCLDYKQMSALCVTSTGRRSWTKEEMMAYLDWSNAEDERVEAQVAKEMGDNPLANARRGVKEIWQRIERDSREQEALY
ncbi:transposase-like protein [Purpureocillium lilacinum]|uniref:Transposase-like protein n=1 Tax=Purpureocillium lilacinum TaxID=33203 RepID=A0A179EYF9_PURLI|nr:transposase-like protein [Purpureocillium lilacinum]